MGSTQSTWGLKQVGITRLRPCKLFFDLSVWPTRSRRKSPRWSATMALACARRCQIKDMDLGWVDTLGLLKTVAFQPRVVKQNHGPAGESLWITVLKSGEYCKSIEEHT